MGGGVEEDNQVKRWKGWREENSLGLVLTNTLQCLIQIRMSKTGRVNLLASQ